MLPIPGKRCSQPASPGEDVPPFRNICPVEILYEFDGPRIFTLHDVTGGLNLACWSVEDETCSRLIVVPTTRQVIEDLRTGSLSLFEALVVSDPAYGPRCWVLDVTHQGKIIACTLGPFADLPRDAIPAIDTPLQRQHCDKSETNGNIPG